MAATTPSLAAGGARRARPWALAVGLVALALLGGCSSTKFAYNRLDMILPWYLERYVELEEAQADWFDARLATLLAWHRAEELPSYVAFLDTLDAALARPLTLAQVQDYSDTLELAWYRVRDPGLDMLLALGEQLSPEQLAGFVAELRKRQEKYEKKYLGRSDEAFRDDAADDLTDALEDYLGRLMPAQQVRVAEAAAALARTDSEWLEERAAWVDEMERLLQRQPGWQAAIRSTIQNWESRLDETTLAVYDRNTLVVQQLIVDVVNSRTERQDRRLRGRIVELRADFADLYGQMDATVAEP